jgi:hypothetical protein
MRTDVKKNSIKNARAGRIRGSYEGLEASLIAWKNSAHRVGAKELSSFEGADVVATLIDGDGVKEQAVCDRCT